MTDSGLNHGDPDKVGVYGAVTILTITIRLEVFMLGVKEMVKKLGKTVEIYEQYTGTFEDVAKGYEAVEPFAGFGVDVV